MTERRPMISLRQAKGNRPVELKSATGETHFEGGVRGGIVGGDSAFDTRNEGYWSPTFPSDVALGKPEFVPASQPDEEDDDDSPQDQGGTDEDYEARLIVAQLEIEELRSA
ncbi:hypothetical protein BC939DRAFT_503533 [Gamsiella multidivaricata]|uniref:uncharacterized protein n=1 Tax=Gamsiella multidivaricata TaxID=101098 RepID=UPI00221E4837|nr:uncharacterized protein BC939DRAFT_503533 [Gamsiella multidivaricata]KAI7823067.1 hypothetical protein BC939DRAFT_503533 [Gamsiella multidivaricata]